ncbi:MAG TPA: RdgB/HAM1 family non-canonical purine NTP pyrophosphatase [Allosphingosinicella sp.]
MRKLGPGKLVVASHNEGKVREIRALLAPYGIEPVSAAELDLPEPDEIGVNFIENADLKARQAADLSGLPALADDSGLCVEALGDRPGIFSARWAEGADGSRDFHRAMQRVEDELQALGPEISRDAHFACALAIVWPDGESEWFEGRVEGTLVWPPRGASGFGYDPIFLPLGRDETFGEMDQAEKHRISHRAEAFRKLVDALL